MSVYYGKFKSWLYAMLSFATTHRQYGKKVAKQINLNIKDKSNVIEGGCGWGRITVPVAKELKKRGIEAIIHAYDVSPNMLKRTDKYARKKGVRDMIELYRADADNLSFAEKYPEGNIVAFEDRSFDAGLYAGLFECVDDREKVLKEQLRVLKPGSPIWLYLIRKNLLGKCASKVPFWPFEVVPKDYEDQFEGIENLREVSIKSLNIYMKRLAGVYVGTVKL